jgi:hypothetical protein
MNDRSLAISILQKARDALSERLTERVIESQAEIEADAEGGSFLSEIETIYDQLGGRLAHLNAMLANLPPVVGAAVADATASEIIYADLASAYPTGLDLDAATPLTLLALPAPVNIEEPALDWLTVAIREIVEHVQAGQLASAGRMLSDLFDIKPSIARCAAAICARQFAADSQLASRVSDLPRTLDHGTEYAATSLLSQCFEISSVDAQEIVRALKQRRTESDCAN